MSPAQLIADLIALDGPRAFRLQEAVTKTALTLSRSAGGFAEDAPFGDGIQGWVLVDGNRRVFVTSQDVPTSHLIERLGSIATWAGLPEFMVHVEVYAGSEGGSLIRTLHDTRELLWMDGPTSAHVGVIGMPTLVLHKLGSPDVGSRSVMLWCEHDYIIVDTVSPAVLCREIYVALVRIGLFCGVPLEHRLWVRHSQGSNDLCSFAIPKPGTRVWLEKAYEGISKGFKLSSSEQTMVSGHGACPTYGELKLAGLSRIFGRISPHGRNFLDMGSGIGRVVLGAGLGFPVSRADGVELSPSRSAAAHAALGRLRLQSGHVLEHVHFYESDMLSIDLSWYDVIFVSNLCFSDDFNRRLCQKFDREFLGQTHVFSSAQLSSEHSHDRAVVDSIAMSWSDLSCLYHTVWER